MIQPHAEPGNAELPDPATLRWVEAVTDRRVVAVQREHAGGSRRLWYVGLDRAPADGDGCDLVLRVDAGGGALEGSPYTLEREAHVYGVLAATEIPAPRLLAARPGALLLERVPGTSRVDEGDDALACSFMHTIGSLHALDATAFDLGPLGSAATTLVAVREELASWRQLADRTSAAPDPLVEYAFAWLDATAPGLARADEPAVLVQGDTGPGNFVADGSRLTGLVDWELSHLGDPMDDVAWIDMRCQTMAGSFGDTARRDRCYADASPFPIDVRSLAFHAVLVRLRCAVTTARTLAVGGGALGLVVYAPPHHRFREELALALLAAVGAEPVVGHDEPIEATASALGELDDDAIAGLRDVVLPAATTKEVKLRARAALLALEHHRQLERLGPALARAESADRRSTLGRDVDDTALAALAAQAGSAGDVTVLGLLHRGARRARRCWDVPSARTMPPLAPPARPTARHVGTAAASDGHTSEGIPRHV